MSNSLALSLVDAECAQMREMKIQTVHWAELHIRGESESCSCVIDFGIRNSSAYLNGRMIGVWWVFHAYLVYDTRKMEKSSRTTTEVEDLRCMFDLANHIDMSTIVQ